MTITPRGESFLPNISMDELNDLYQKEKDPTVKIRLLSAILRKEGKTLEEISLTVKHPLTTVGDWLRRLHTEGISRKNDKKRSGRPKRLIDKQTEDIGSSANSFQISPGAGLSVHYLDNKTCYPSDRTTL